MNVAAVCGKFGAGIKKAVLPVIAIKLLIIILLYGIKCHDHVKLY